MYTAKSVAKSVKDGSFSVTVEFTDGKDTFQLVFSANSGLDPNWLQNRVASQLLSLNTLASFADDFELGDISGEFKHGDPTDRDLWGEDLRLLEQMNRAIELGLMDGTEKEFLAQKKKVVDGFTQDYLGLLKF